MDKKEQKKEKKRNCDKDSCELDFIGESIDTDPFGMYTGVPKNPYEEPVQDADDL